MLLFTSRHQGYFNFRIPALVCTARGSLLVFCSARYGNGDDWAASDLVMRRRPSGQAHWEAMAVLAANGEQPHDNAVPIASRTGKVHLLYSVNSCRLFYCWSDDDGVSFGPAREVTQVLEGFRSRSGSGFGAAAIAGLVVYRRSVAPAFGGGYRL